ncbi:MAG: malate dehydrogenase, partial [Gammaproteobacteria bacterium]
RAKSQLAAKAGVPVADVTNATIWGNHSNNQYPDFENAKINGRPAPEVIGDEVWLKEVFIPTIQERGAAVIKARGASSAASAANAALDHVKSLITPTAPGDWFSAGVCSNGEYGVDPGLMFGYPLTSSGNGDWKVVEGLPMSDWAKSQFEIALNELRQEREVVKDLLRG